MGILIKNGTVVRSDTSQKLDVLIEGEKIARVGTRLDEAGHDVVDADGLLVMPGGIDVHTHLDMPFGGTTSADDYTELRSGWGLFRRPARDGRDGR